MFCVRVLKCIDKVSEIGITCRSSYKKITSNPINPMMLFLPHQSYSK